MIPVVSDPVDVVQDATPPVYTESDVEWWEKWLDVAKLIISVLILILAVYVVYKVIGWIVKIFFKGDKKK